MIKSVSYSQEEIIKDIINLHLDGKDIEADITYSKGQFYKNGVVKQPIHKFDKYPQTSNIIQLTDRIPLADKSVLSVMCDLPFVISKGPSLLAKQKGQNVISSRFSSFENPNELFKCYSLWIGESYRVLKDGGKLIFKCQDTVSGGKNYFIHNYSFNEALKVGFYPKDLAILVAKNRIISGKHKNQFHMRKFHSYFWVFSKEKCRISYKFV